MPGWTASKGMLNGGFAAALIAVVSPVIIASPCAAKSAHRAVAQPNWSYTTRPDKLRGGSDRTACTSSKNLVRLSFPYKSQNLRFCVRNAVNSGLNIYLSLPYGGQFMCSPIDGCTVQRKMDKGGIVENSAVSADDGSTDIIFLENEKDILSALVSSTHMTLEVDFYQAGTQQLEFDVSNFKPAD